MPEPEDHGVDGDRLWLEVRDRDGVIVDEISLEDPATVNAVDISGGNIVVPHTTKRGGSRAE